MKASLVILAFALATVCNVRGGLQLPEPPQQHKSWHADASIPTNILSAVETLFEQGFPDPRGCEYREIEVQVSGMWNSKSSLVKTRGWMLPAKSRDTNRFAICWNGLVYPVAKISAPADLHQEITNQFRPVTRTLTNSANGTNKITERFIISGAYDSSGLDWRNNSAAGEERTVLFANASSTRVMLLLRCGEIEAALKSWQSNRRFMGFGGGGGNGSAENNGPYLEFASDWAWALFDRTISAHTRGDEALALATARKLTEVQPKIEAEAAKRGFRRPQNYDSARPGKEKPYLDFLDQLPQLLADLERRDREGPRVSVVEAGLQKIPDQSARIAALIRDLDLAEGAVVSALIQEGDAAVEPLLDCLENDKRLTRSVGYGRSNFRNHTVASVNSVNGVALSAVQSILQAGFGGGAPEIRAYWNKYKNLKIEDRWYAILQDDAANGRWLEAAAHITQPEKKATVSNPAPTNATVHLRGEILRSKSNPSVSELMVRRATEVQENNPNAYDLAAACEMGLQLTSWDAQAAESVVKILVKRCHTVMTYSGQQLGNFLVKFALFRARAGDEQAFDDYAEWLKTTTPEQLGRSILESLEPLQKFPTNEVLQAAAEKLFTETNSAWSKLPWKGMVFDNPVESDLANVPAFRVLIARELENTNLCGSFEWRSANQLGFSITNLMNMSGSRSVSFPESEQPAVGTKAELRWCDWIAVLLSRAKRIPFFNPFAPVEKRDEEIQNAKELLLRR